MSPRNSLHAEGLFVTYDGLLEPLGQSQIIPYLVSLANSGIGIHIVSFEKNVDSQDPSRSTALENQLQACGITWRRLTYHRRPRIVSTLFDLLLGMWVCVREAHRRRIRIVHARSYIPALMVLPVKWLTGAAFIFDIRGFWPEERVQMGIFRSGGILFRTFKRMEKVFWRNAARLVALTENAKAELASRPEWDGRSDKIVVIPCCVDLHRFKSNGPSAELLNRQGLAGKHVVGNIGAVSRMYLVPEMFQFVVALKSRIRNLHLVYLTRQEPEPLFRMARSAGLDPESLTVVEATPTEIPEWLSIFELGIFFPNPCFATRAMSPTKLGEFLAAGVPVVTSADVGDIAAVVNPETEGVLLHGFSESEVATAADQASKLVPLTETTRNACRRGAAKHFDLNLGCRRYLAMYRDVLSGDSKVLHDLQQERA